MVKGPSPERAATTGLRRFQTFLPSPLNGRFDPKQPVVAGENISRPRSRADDQVSVIRRKRPAGFGGRLLSWLMAYGHENSPRSGLDDTIDELAILHAPLAKPSDRLP